MFRNRLLDVQINHPLDGLGTDPAVAVWIVAEHDAVHLRAIEPFGLVAGTRKSPHLTPGRGLFTLGPGIADRPSE